MFCLRLFDLHLVLTKPRRHVRIGTRTHTHKHAHAVRCESFFPPDSFEVFTGVYEQTGVIDCSRCGVKANEEKLVGKAARERAERWIPLTA